MSALDDLLGKKKPEASAIVPKAESVEPKETKENLHSTQAKVAALGKISGEKVKKAFSLNLGATKDVQKEPEKPEQVDGEKLSGAVHSTDPDPFAGLANTLDNIGFDLSQEPDKIPEVDLIPEAVNRQFQNPTLDDVSKFVFEEQPDQSTEEITESFSSMLDELAISTGDQVPLNLAKNLKQAKEYLSSNVNPKLVLENVAVNIY